MERELKSLERLIDEVTLKVFDNHMNIKGDELLNFRRYFEDVVLSQSLGEAHPTSAYKMDSKVSKNLLSALIAAGIKRDASEITEEYPYLYTCHTRENYEFAKNRIKENELDYVDDYDYGHKIATVYSKVKATDDEIEPSDLIKIATTMHDRINGYNELATNTEVYLESAKELWKEEKRKYIRDGLTNKPYYKILNDLFNFSNQHHYPLVTREAYDKVATLTYKLDKDLKVNRADLQDMYRFNDASKIIGTDVAMMYNDSVKEVMREYTERHKAVQKTR